MEELIKQIISSFDTEVSIAATSPSKNGKKHHVCLLNPSNIYGRTQPVNVELEPCSYDSDLLILTLKTPLGDEETIQTFIDKYSIFQFPYEEEFPMVKMCIDHNANLDDLYRIYMKVDMPIIVNLNALSKYEINAALNDLITCADLIERFSFGQKDIHMEELDNGTVTANIKKGDLQLRTQLYKDSLNDPWHVAINKKYIFLKKTLQDNPVPLFEQWQLNHQYPFVKFLAVQQRMELTLSYFSEDIQQVEQDVLNKIFNIVNTMVTKPLESKT